MKKCWIIGLLALTLCGCGMQETFETVSDVYEVGALTPLRELSVSLPEEAAQLVLQSQEAGTLYFCNGYTVAVQTLDGGDLNKTLYSVTGYGENALSPLTTRRQDATCYECAWTAAGEGTQQIGRAVILDDGSYHYAVSVMADAENAGQLRKTWDSLLTSVRLKDTD